MMILELVYLERPRP
jgi:hypothetical protein